MVRVPTIVFRKKKTLVTRPVALPLCQGCSNGQVQVQNSPRPAAVSSYPSPVKSGKSQTYTSNVIFPESYDQYGNDDYSP
ncbi:hypothetical protein BLA29_012679 [Euroglyphus maynei]|uniref:Uncharacterized protein n=1 Tax=Euroglyphus maynei TaxID=6958 RepID=A0A1Y3AP40_EURMA|nr:hypothetical protein BLA29_012679 [Euroglyphus maynei]